MYLGVAGTDWSEDIVADADGRALIVGTTDSPDFEGRYNSRFGSRSAFILMVSPSARLHWMKYVGGAGDTSGTGIALDSAGDALLSGDTSAIDFEGQRNSSHGGYDAYLARLDLDSGPRLSVLPTCPWAGPFRIEWSYATEGSQVALIFASETGSVLIPDHLPCSGIQLGLGSTQIRLVWRGGAGEYGMRTLNANAGPHACGGYLQLLDLATCATSNMARIE